MAKKMFLLFTLIISFFIKNIYSESVSGIVHKYGFYALGDNVSTLFYNPAGLFNLSSHYDEFVISTRKTFTYSDFAIGKYITRFNLFSSSYPSSINIGIGVNESEKFDFGIGGTLIDFLKYGINIKYINIGGEKYWDTDIGFMMKFKFFPSKRYSKPEISFGCAVKNLQNKIYDKYFVPSIYIRPFNGLKITSGINFDKDFNTEDYSFAFDLNIIGNFDLLAGIQKYTLPIGFKWSLTEILRKEVIFVAAQYNRSTHKFDGMSLSYRHRFEAFKISENKTSGRNRKVRKYDTGSEEDMESSVSPKVIKQQKKILEKAKFYFAQEKLRLAERKFKEVLRINKTSDVADEARDWLDKIKKIRKNLR